MYNKGDDTFLSQPKVMSEQTVEALVDQVAAHCAQHNIHKFYFAFHGGEPLLAGHRMFQFFVSRARTILEPAVEATFSVQTNGTILDQKWCTLLKELNIRVGISLDGPEGINDLHRKTHSGDGSYHRVRRGWNAAVQAGLHPSILTVVNPTSSPVQIFSHLKMLGPRNVDFLLPEATYDAPPPGVEDGIATPYADWLISIFHLWKAEEFLPFGIRFFEQILSSVFGLGSQLDSMGTGENEVIVVETDGAIEPVDVLRVCASGLTRTQFNVKNHSLDLAMEQQLIQLYHYSNTQLCTTCKKCPINKICGGGYLSHRYSSENLFDNPSIYCRDLMKLITTLRDYALSLLPAEALAQSKLGATPYSVARAILTEPLAD